MEDLLKSSITGKTIAKGTAINTYSLYGVMRPATVTKITEGRYGGITYTATYPVGRDKQETARLSSRVIAEWNAEYRDSYLRNMGRWAWRVANRFLSGAAYTAQKDAFLLVSCDFTQSEESFSAPEIYDTREKLLERINENIRKGEMRWSEYAEVGLKDTVLNGSMDHINDNLECGCVLFLEERYK